MKHEVQFTVPRRDLGRADVLFDMSVNDEKLGTLGVSKGSLVWYPKNTSYGHRVTWSQFDRLMQDHPRVEKR